MAGLIELRATDNRLTSLPESVGRLSRLRELHLRNNRLTSLPRLDRGIAGATADRPPRQPIEHLPATIAALPRLEKLDLRWVTTLVLPAWVGDLVKHAAARSTGDGTSRQSEDAAPYQSVRYPP